MMSFSFKLQGELCFAVHRDPLNWRAIGNDEIGNDTFGSATIWTGE
jgi:hypothetical protein